jgi:hypothetical protein
MNKVNNPKDEKCHYCDDPGLYWDQLSATIITVCKKHATNYYAS